MQTIACRKLLLLLLFPLIAFFYACIDNDPDDHDYYKVISPNLTTDTGKGIPQGNNFNKNWDMSAEAGADLVGLYTNPSGITYAISNYGIIYSRFGGLDWKRENIDFGYARFTAIGGYDNDIYAVGPHSTLFHKSGTGSWIREKAGGNDLDFTTVYALKNELWLTAGNNGFIWHRSSTGEWKEDLSTRGSTIFALYGNGEDLWALCKKSVYHKKSGGDWVTELSVDKEVNFYTLYQNNNHVWVMGTGSSIYYNSGGKQWIKEKATNIEEDITCSYGKGDEIYAAGLNGLILHRSPSGQWKKEENVYQDFIATCMYGRDQDIWIAGHDGFIIHKKGNEPWTKETGPARRVKINAFSNRGDTVFAAGDYATLMTRTEGKAWTKANTLMPDTPLTGIFKYAKDILVAGKNGTLYHRLQNGHWQLENSYAGNTVFADLYETEQNVYLVGNGGTITWRHKTDSIWKSEIIASANLNKIYGYDNDIWIMGSHSTILHKKEKDKEWKEINIGISEVEFIDVYGWKDQVWALGMKDNRGIIFYKNGLNNWSKENIPASLDHYHALYGLRDTIWAVGASGYWGLKYKANKNYAGMIICREGNNPWKKQTNYLPGVHFDAINGIGDDIYAIGNAGNVYHKKGNNDWEQQETFHDNDDLKKIIFYKGLVMLSEEGFLYKENEEKSFISINKTDKLINFVALNDNMFCIGNSTIFKLNPEEEKYPVVDKVSYSLKPFINPTSINLKFVLQRPKMLSSNDMYRVEIYARPYFEEYDGYKWVEVNADSTKVMINKEKNSFLFSQNIELAKSLRVIPGLKSANKVSIRVDVMTEDGRARESFVLKDNEGNPFFTLSNNFWLTYKLWIISASVLVLYYAFWLFLWFFYPLSFLQIYHSEKLQQLMLLKPPFHFLIGIVNILFPLKRLVETVHVQNAWIMNFAAIAADKYEKSETIQLRSYYVALPVRIGNAATGMLVEKPDDTILEKIFNKDRSIIQIIGSGGAGKTSLEAAIGRWMIQLTKNRKRNQLPRLPILLETDSIDLLTDVTRMLRSWQNDYSIHEDFVKILLKSQRLVVIIDSLSERPIVVQNYFKTLHGNTPVNALIISARTPIDLQVKEGIHLYPIPLNSNNLLHFITTCLNIYPNHPLRKIREQLALAEKIVSIIEVNNNKATISPLLVKLMVEIAIKTEGNDKKDFQTILKEMPHSIPELYYQYLIHVNPTNPAAANYLPKQMMLQIAELLGQLSLGDNYVPKDFPEELAREKISLAFDNITCDPIQRFIDNSILTRKESLGRFYLRFNIDTLAECLTASKLYDEKSSDQEQLLAFIDKVRFLNNAALEFKIAFSQVRDYKKTHG